MDEGERGDHPLVLEVEVILAHLVRQQHPLVDDGARREGRRVEIAVGLAQGGDPVLDLLADDEQLALERVLVRAVRRRGRRRPDARRVRWGRRSRPAPNCRPARRASRAHAGLPPRRALRRYGCSPPAARRRAAGTACRRCNRPVGADRCRCRRRPRADGHPASGSGFPPRRPPTGPRRPRRGGSGSPGSAGPARRSGGSSGSLCRRRIRSRTHRARCAGRRAPALRAASYASYASPERFRSCTPTLSRRLRGTRVAEPVRSRGRRPAKPAR